MFIRSKIDPIFQTEVSECGLACVAMILSAHGYNVSLSELRSKFGSSRYGTTLLQIQEILKGFGLQTRCLRMETDEFALLRLPCVAHWRMDHFVVVEELSGHEVTIIDPSVGRRRVGKKELDKEFTGVALEASPTVNFKTKKRETPIPIGTLMRPIRGRWRSLILLLILSFGVQACFLASPFYIQWITDQVLSISDTRLLLALAIGFALVSLFAVVMSMARGWTVAYVANRMSVEWVGSVFQTLLRLPMDYFTKRDMADVASRFQSIRVIQRTLTVSFVEALLDGMMTILTFVLMGYYSMPLALLSLGAVIIYLTVRWIAFMPAKIGAEKQMILAAKQESYLIESIRGIQSIKTMELEHNRASSYLNHITATSNAEFSLAKIGIIVQGSSQMVFGLERIAVIAIAAMLVLERSLTVGMLFAYLAYKDQFTTRINNLIDKALEFKMLKLHAHRLSDIVLTQEESYGDESCFSWDSPEIEVSNLSFRYSAADRWVLRDCSFRVKAGESIAIVGPSGCGKSTLLKLLAGLYLPNAGQISIGGKGVAGRVRGIRRELGVVMQDDQLFSGTIAENIAAGEVYLSIEEIRIAAQRAMVDGEIEAMPMKYQTFIGDMGGLLSSGQKQRILLARALFREPAILILDEATSHLDIESERAITESIRTLQMTRIIVTHRKESIDSADRVLHMVAGRVINARVGGVDGKYSMPSA